jgi:proline racemase
MFEVTTIDAHVAGGAVRLITAGLPHIEAASLVERQQLLTERAAPTLAALTREPRGHSGVIVVVPAEPDAADADAGLLFYRSSGPATPCGHALIGATGLAITRGVLAPRTHGTVRYDTTAGRMTATTVALPGGGPLPVRYTGPGAAVLRPNVPINLGRRNLRADLVWSGTELVAIVDAETAGVPLVSSRALELQRAGLAVLQHLDEALRVMHPETGSRVPVASAVFIGPAPESGIDVRSGSVLTDGIVEQTPGGSATAAIAAVLSAMGLLHAGRRLVHQGVMGTTLWATILATTEMEGRPTVDVEIGGESWPTGDHVFRFDEADPLAACDWDR